ncbi:NO-inducible flavohemoprotein [Arcicella sp. DC2W]|uniref:nitric oxide dioxygenase n=1 Tax=Arcicella gelida TaxID=2984195 RepID=A0ABU5S724_9BACT|nr:NO-inducible flavohemoprotein [Arcicella sp. DC2W]MEA5404229.1 NO-inducible flavohemoprotein [Arcicella sp. DC2W]
MASQKTIEIVKSTAPVLAIHGESITKVFYQLLFQNHPELKNVFNMTHQTHGTQSKALANAVYAYAANIDNLAVLSAAVEQITQKHSSLSITPAMYQLVGANLLAAIKEVLQDAATPEIMDAWAEAYGDLASLFIKKEEQLYQNAEAKKGGFRGQKEFAITKKEAESSNITSFYFKPADGSAIPSFKGGQYIAVSVQIPDLEHLHTRNYSLSGCPTQNTLRISVKRETGSPDGVVSNFLHDHLVVGDTVKLGIPAGEFVLAKTEKPIVLIAGGVGITPLMSMYMELFHFANNEVLFVQCAKNSSVHAFKAKSQKLAKQKPSLQTISLYDEPLSTDIADGVQEFSGLLTIDILKEKLSTLDAEYYFCGPVGFMKSVKQMLESAEIPASQLHYEFFGPSEALA